MVCIGFYWERKISGMRVVSILLLIFLNLSAITQNLIVEEGGIFLNGKSNLNVYQTNISLNGGIIEGSDSSALMVNADTSSNVIEGHGIIVFDTILVTGSIENEITINTNYLNLNEGNLTLEFADVLVDSLLENESELFNVTGVSLKTNFLPLVNQQVSPANFGISFVFSDSETSLELTRTNNFVKFEDSYSIKKQFGFDRAVNTIEEVSFKYFNKDAGELHNESLFRVFTSTDGFDWTEQTTLNIDTIENNITATVDGMVRYFTLLEGEPDYELFIPNGFSPNDDGTNDKFEILGLKNYPNNKLVVINTSGVVVFEAQPYENNWFGNTNTNAENELPTGTYFYRFYTDTEDPKSVLQGFIELRGGR